MDSTTTTLINNLSSVESLSTSPKTSFNNAMSKMNGARAFQARFSNRSDLYFQVHIENELICSTAKQICFVMTIHDLGYDYTEFNEFIYSSPMVPLNNRIVWLHVNLPGQELDASDLTVKKYPSLEEIGDELVTVLDHLNVSQVVCMGHGVGANIAVHFSDKHPSRCLGLVLIEPNTAPASMMQNIKFKLFQRRRSLSMNEKDVPAFIGHSARMFQRRRTLSININSPDVIHEACEGDITLVNDNSHFEEQSSVMPILSTSPTSETFNNKNLTLFADSVFNRPNLDEKLIKIDTMVVTGKNSKSNSDVRRLYKGLQECNKRNPEKLVNSPLIELENASDVLRDSKERLATSLQYFLQGIGVLSAMPFRRSVCESNMDSYSRSILLKRQIRSESIDPSTLTSTPSLVSRCSNEFRLESNTMTVND